MYTLYLHIKYTLARNSLSVNLFRQRIHYNCYNLKAMLLNAGSHSIAFRALIEPFLNEK